MVNRVKSWENLSKLARPEGNFGQQFTSSLFPHLSSKLHPSPDLAGCWSYPSRNHRICTSCYMAAGLNEERRDSNPKNNTYLDRCSIAWVYGRLLIDKFRLCGRFSVVHFFVVIFVLRIPLHRCAPYDNSAVLLLSLCNHRKINKYGEWVNSEISQV